MPSVLGNSTPRVQMLYLLIQGPKSEPEIILSLYIVAGGNLVGYQLFLKYPACVFKLTTECTVLSKKKKKDGIHLHALVLL